MMAPSSVAGAKYADGRYAGVTVEASYDVGEYDVSILSAQESDGLINFLTDNGYKIPNGAEPAYYRFYAHISPAELAKGWTRDRVVAAINAENAPVNQCQCDLAQGGLFRFIPVFPRRQFGIA